MKNRFQTAVLNADPRVVWFGIMAIALFVAFEGWHLVLRTPLTQWRQLHDTRVALAAAMASAPREPAELSRIADEVKTLRDTLREELKAGQSDEQLTALLMADLDRSASSGGAVLKGVKPGGRQSVGGFSEVSYEVSAEGRYVMLGRWMLDLESVLGRSAAVTEFSLKALPETRQASASLKVALYRGRGEPQPQGAK
jgi:Tfp pilus assembly protein PilO